MCGGGVALPESFNPEPEKDIEYIRIGATTYEVASYYGGTVSLMELIKDALKRDAEAVLRRSGEN
jgi:hypothetical protein